MDILTIAFCLLVPLHILYGAFTLLLLKAWKEMPVFSIVEKGDGATHAFISVIIPVRNEEAHIGALLEDLSRQSYKNFEVMVVNDASTDATVAIVEEYISQGKLALSLLHLTEEVKRSHKKAAIKMAIEHSKGDLISTTDGDCRVGEEWLQTIHAFYQQEKPKLISAGVTFGNHKNWFEKVQTVEFMSLIGAGAASMYLKMPNMCNGANLTYERSAFEAVNGFDGKEHIASGDDEFLMHKIHHQYPEGGVRFLKSKEALVTTEAQPSLKAFYHQRKRWASKWDKYDNWQAIAVAVFIYVLHLSSTALLLGTWYLPDLYLWIGVSLLLLKALVEYTYLNGLMAFYGHRGFGRYILLTECIHSIYIVWIGIAGKMGQYQWKGRHN